MLHVFYNSRNLDSCLAAWATRHGLGEKAVELRSGEIEYHPDMLLLNRGGNNLRSDGAKVEILSLQHRTNAPNKAQGSVSLLEKHSPLACCLLAWNRFHASQAPWLLDRIDEYLDGKEGVAQQAYNAMLSQHWTMPLLDKLIPEFETPRTRANLLLDGTVILAYRKLRGDLCPA